MSSSNRPAMRCEAVVYHDTRAVGPVRLPSRAKADFVNDFNRIYAPARIEIIDEPEQPITVDETEP